MESVIVKIEFMLDDEQNFAKRKDKIRKLITQLKEYADMSVVNVVDQHGFFKFHHYRLSANLSRKLGCKNFAEKDEALAKQYAKYENWLNLSCIRLYKINTDYIELDDEREFARVMTGLFEKITFVTEKLKQIVRIFLYRIENMSSFSEHRLAFDYLMTQVARTKKHTMSLDDYLIEKTRIMRITFFEQVVLKLQPTEMSAFFFNNQSAASAVNASFRNYVFQFSGDMNSTFRTKKLNSLYTEVLNLMQKTAVAEMEYAIKCMNTEYFFEKFFNEAVNLFRIGVEYYTKFKCNLTYPGLKHIELALEKFKTACCIADSLGMENKMVSCRVLIVACLLLCEKPLEAKIVALGCFLMIEDSITSYRRTYFDRTNLLIQRIEQGDIENILADILNSPPPLDEPKANVLNGHINERIQLYKLLCEYISKNMPDNEMPISVDPHEDETDLYSTQSVLAIRNPRKRFRFSIDGGVSMRENLEDILKRAHDAFSENKFAEFLQILSEEYASRKSLVKQSYYLNYSVNVWQVKAEKIKSVLLNNGFRPDAIALLLIAIFVALAHCQIPIHDYFDSGIAIMSAIVNEDEKSGVDLEHEAGKLDEAARKKQHSAETGRLRHLRQRVGNLCGRSRGKDLTQVDSDSDASLTETLAQNSFKLRFKKIKTVAFMHFILMHLMSAKKMSPELKAQLNEALDVENDYFNSAFLTTELLKDFIWMFTSDSDILSLLYPKVLRKCSFANIVFIRRDDYDDNDEPTEEIQSTPKAAVAIDAITVVENDNVTTKNDKRKQQKKKLFFKK